MVASDRRRLSNGLYLELHTFVLLDATDDLKEVAGVGIPGWSEHAHEALGRSVREGAELSEPDGGVDLVA